MTPKSGSRGFFSPGPHTTHRAGLAVGGSLRSCSWLVTHGPPTSPHPVGFNGNAEVCTAPPCGCDVRSFSPCGPTMTSADSCSVTHRVATPRAVPSPTASLGLDYAVCSPCLAGRIGPEALPLAKHKPSSGRFESRLGLAPLALRLPPDPASRHRPCLRLVLSLLTMSPSRYSHRGLPPHKFAPMLGAHTSLNRTCHGVGLLATSISAQTGNS